MGKKSSKKNLSLIRTIMKKKDMKKRLIKKQLVKFEKN